MSESKLGRIVGGAALGDALFPAFWLDKHRALVAGQGQLAFLAERSMQLQATIQEGQLTLSSDKGTVFVEPERWK